ncbi:MAG: enoyl-CoA hydratase/isomerase family protein [Holophagaceae bacterium]
MRTTLKVIKLDQSAWIQMESVDGLPRLSRQTLQDLDRTMKALKWEGHERLILSGRFDGSTAYDFCAGADLREVQSLEPLTALEFSALGQSVAEQLLWPGWKTLTLLSGVVMGGGCDLALHGQERWAIESPSKPLKLQHPAALHGLITGFGGTHRINQLLGHVETLKFFKNLEVWDGATCQKRGLVSRVLDAEAIETALRAWQSQRIQED